MSRSRATLAMALVALATGNGARAAQPLAPVDAELLEFLGSLDTEEEEWREFLAERPIRPEAGKPAGKPDAKSARNEPAGAEHDKVKKP